MDPEKSAGVMIELSDTDPGVGVEVNYLGDIASVRVYRSEHAPMHYDDGRPRLFQIAPDFHDEPIHLTPMFNAPPKRPDRPIRWCVVVHPSRWDAFWMAVNQPNVFAHPEVQELLGWAERQG